MFAGISLLRQVRCRSGSERPTVYLWSFEFLENALIQADVMCTVGQKIGLVLNDGSEMDGTVEIGEQVNDIFLYDGHLFAAATAECSTFVRRSRRSPFDKHGRCDKH
jgi:hypothetical protein